MERDIRSAELTGQVNRAYSNSMTEPGEGPGVPPEARAEAEVNPVNKARKQLREYQVKPDADEDVIARGIREDVVKKLTENAGWSGQAVHRAENGEEELVQVELYDRNDNRDEFLLTPKDGFGNRTSYPRDEIVFPSDIEERPKGRAYTGMKLHQEGRGDVEIVGLKKDVEVSSGTHDVFLVKDATGKVTLERVDKLNQSLKKDDDTLWTTDDPVFAKEEAAEAPASPAHEDDESEANINSEKSIYEQIVEVEFATLLQNKNEELFFKIFDGITIGDDGNFVDVDGNEVNIRERLVKYYKDNDTERFNLAFSEDTIDEDGMLTDKKGNKVDAYNLTFNETAVRSIYERANGALVELVGRGSGFEDEEQSNQVSDKGDSNSPTEYRFRRGERIPKPELSNPNEIADPVLKQIAHNMRSALDSGNLISDTNYRNELRRKIEEKLSDPNTEFEARALRYDLDRVEEYAEMHAEYVRAGTESTLSLTLTPADIEALDRDPTAWIKSQLNRVYDLSIEGSEFDSQMLNNVRGLQEASSRYLLSRGVAREYIRDYDEEFRTLVNTMYIRAGVQSRDIDTVTGMASRTGTHGILNVLSYENGMVGFMNSRIQELADDIRIRSRQHHLTPEENSKIQQQVIEEMSVLIEADSEMTKAIVGDAPMSDEMRKELIRAAVVRSTRSGYDQHVGTQREAVIVARGEKLPTSEDLEGIIAEPSGLFEVFNFEQMLIAKFGIPNKEQRIFFNALKRRYAESVLAAKASKKELKDEKGNNINIDQWIDAQIEKDPQLAKDAKANKVSLKEQALINYGQGLMKDLMLVNDFYSSGWRVEAFLKQIQQVVKYKKAEQYFRAENGEDYERLREILDDKKDISVEAYKRKDKAQREYSEQISKYLTRVTAQDMDQAHDFGLFMQLRGLKAHSKYKKGQKDTETEMRDVWGRIAKYKPEDIIKIIREKGSEDEIAKFKKAFSELGIEATGDLAQYDKFKDEFGGAIRLVRQRGFSQGVPEQIDFSKLNLTTAELVIRDFRKRNENPPSQSEAEAIAKRNNEYGNLLVKALAKGDASPEARRQAIEKANKLVKFYSDISEITNTDEIKNMLINDTRYEDIYTRTYATDDALLDKLEDSDQYAGFVQLSRKLDPDAGGAAFRRTFNDMKNAKEGHTHFMNFLRADNPEEKMKESLAAGEATSHYAGPSSRAKVFRYTYGSYMLMGAVSEKGKGLRSAVYEVLDMKKMPFNRPINELQEIFGMEAPAFNNDEMYKFIEQHQGDFIGEDEELYEEIKKLAKTRTKDRAEFMALRALIYGMIWLAFEVAHDTAKTVSEGTKEVDTG